MLASGGLRFQNTGRVFSVGLCGARGGCLWVGVERQGLPCTRYTNATGSVRTIGNEQSIEMNDPVLPNAFFSFFSDSS